ncbi:MAG TPA: FAD-dependent oxidoreductase [Solirubrobacteraceae bacterium]|jgi:sarcosine oxidase|nr:FAD-dependent oxidoreductase [Solirubrobacteraceae bacterium]
MRVGVVGGGIIGLAAAEALSRRGAAVTIFDRSGPGGGQSGGLTRIFRHLHRSDAQTRLAVDARLAWRELERRSGRRLVGAEGVLVAGGDLDLALERLVRAGAPAELVDGRHVERLLPILGRDAGPAVLDADGGAIRVRRALECLEGLLPGGAIARQEVFGVSPGGSGASVEATEGSLRFDHVVVAAGAETARFAAGLGIELPERRGVHPRLMFDVGDGSVGLPCYVDRTAAHGESAYAGPVGSSPRYVVGLSAGETLPLGAGETTLGGGDDFDELYARTVAYVRRAMPGLDPDPVAFRLCHVTALTGDSDAFGVWEREAVTVFAGHNVMKFAPLIGESLARLIVDGESDAGLPRFGAPDASQPVDASNAAGPHADRSHAAGADRDPRESAAGSGDRRGSALGGG